MAEQINFPGANIHASPPKGYEEMIDWLHCFHNGACCVSAWQFTKEQWEQLSKDRTIFMSVMSGTREDGRPIILPVFVGTEDDCREIVSDTGKVW